MEHGPIDYHPCYEPELPEGLRPLSESEDILASAELEKRIISTNADFNAGTQLTFRAPQRTEEETLQDPKIMTEEAWRMQRKREPYGF